MTIRVLLADDHAVVREGVAALLASQPDMKVVGQAGSGREAVEMAAELTPDVVLMDVTMPGISGVEATHQIVDTVPGTRVLALTMHEGREFFFRMIQAGAAGYVLKGASSDVLLDAIRSVSAGGVYMNPVLARSLIDDYVTKVRTPTDLDALTAREREVLSLIAEGHTNREIADKLIISVNTVATHRQHVMDKLGLHDKGELIKYAIQVGLISLPS